MKAIKNTPLPPKTEIKNYTIINTIDVGGYSIVYYAYDKKMDRYVAIKEFMPNNLTLRTQGTEIIIKDEKTLRTFNFLVERFYGEIQIVNRINHPNIVKGIDYFTANNTAYLVTPYEVGQTLATHISHVRRQNKTMPEKDVFQIITGVIRAVQEMHRNSILHLDLKPNNIWLRPNKDVVILDFGTAQPEHENRGLHVYTGGYSPIELYAHTTLPKKDYHENQLAAFYETQQRIRSSYNDVVGRWTDYYAIGATLFNMLVLKIPPVSYELYRNGKQISTTEMYGTTHIKLIDTINKLCQHDINARKTINLQDIYNTLKNATPYPKFDLDLADVIGNRPSYVMRQLHIS